jgi:RNA polymerase sigma-70 factor (ECF subfamily)
VQQTTTAQPHLRTDTVLMSRIGRGDRSALAELYDRYAPVMLALARRILVDSEDAEDLLHHVFVEVMHQADRYDSSRGTVRAWLITKTRSRAIDRLRARRRNQALNAMLSFDASEHHLELSDRIGVQMGLTHLPEHMRAVLSLMYYEGRTASEIAIEMDCPVGTVKSRLSRATQKLRGILTEN